MTNPTPISTASSSDDLVERYFSKIHQHAVDGQNGSASYALDRLAQIEKVADLGLNLLRQPVAGDVVERVIDRNELAILLTRYGEFGTNQESNLNTALKAADAILKLIGGGK